MQNATFNSRKARPVQIAIAVGIIAVLTLLISCNNYSPERIDYFVSIKDVVPDIQYEIRYAGHHNFIGRPVKGYHNPEALFTKEAAAALKKVQADLSIQGLGLKVFDAYRPQIAVDDFVEWARDLGDTVNKQEFYPQVPKSELFKRGYIA